MYISQLDIENYKTFDAKQTLVWEQGFNLLLGPNNSGKTSILEALTLDWNHSNPHRSSRSVPTYGGMPPGRSKIRCKITSTFNEICQSTSGHVVLPINPSIGDADAINRCRESIEKNSQIFLDFTYGGGAKEGIFSDDDGLLGSRIVFGNEQNNRALNIRVHGLRAPEITMGYMSANLHLGNLIENAQSRIYKFSALRRPASRSGSVGHQNLDPEATHLPYCLNYLQTNDSDGHRLLCEWVNRIFPSVKWVQSTSLLNEFEIRCLPVAPSARRDDLATSMSSMGTGIGNVLAMLYVVLTARTPQLIAIDEPNAFLHPKALRELLAILEIEGKQHQFILTAHSADVLTSVTAKTISVLKFDDIATTVDSVTLADIHQIRSSLADLGIRVTDLHAKDQVLWVEGQTEELVLPEILRWACPEIAAGTAVLRVERTGTFTKKNMKAAEVAALYERLSTSSALVPPMVTILLDSELLKAAEISRIEKDSHGKLRYLPMRMLENYVLNVDAIKNALEEHGVECTSEAISEQLLLAGFDSHSNVRKVDGASILRQVFSNLSDAKIEFRKTRDVPSLVNQLIENNPAHLVPLRQFLRDLFALK